MTHTLTKSGSVSPAEVQSLRDLVLTAQGKKEATLLLKNCQLVNVNSGEIYSTDIGIYENRIASITAGAINNAREIIDCQGKYAIPGLIDPHMHVDTTLLWPGELARVLVPLGTTTVFVDTTNIAHTGGTAAIKMLIDAFDGLPLRAYFSAPSYCPLNPSLETAATEVTMADIAEMLEWAGIVSIGETVSSKILNVEEDYLSRLALCSTTGKISSGHSGDLPEGVESALDAYVAAGIGDDHCVSDVSHILQRLRRGLTLFLVEAPGRRQLKRLLNYVLENNIPTHKLCMCVDNITVMDMVAAGDGYLDKLVRIGLEVGLPPVEVIRMATLNPSTHYGKAHRIGNLAPGRLADIVLLETLDKFPPEIVIINGKVVAREGKLLEKIGEPKFSPVYMNSIYLNKDFSPEHLKVWANDGMQKVDVRVIRVVDSEAFNKCIVATLNVIDGQVQPDIAQDILKIAVVERYGRNGNLTSGFVQGFGLHRGAIATSVSVPSNNIVVVGTNDEDMALAVRHLEKIQGGFVVIDHGKVLADVHLPIGGVMAEVPYEELVEAIKEANAAAQRLGCKLEHPFFTMSQTVLITLPDVGLTDRGMVDALTGEFVDILVKESK